MGVEPKVPVAFSAALQWTNANVRTWRGADILNLNARHDSFRLVGDLVATVAHELIHDAQARLHDDESLPPVLRTLYREGAAVFGVSLLFPKMGDAALGMKAQHVEKAKQVTSEGAAALLAALDGDRAGGRRFFQGGFTDPLLPPRMGYFLGLRGRRRRCAWIRRLSALKPARRSPGSLPPFHDEGARGAEPLGPRNSGREVPPGAGAAERREVCQRVRGRQV